MTVEPGRIGAVAGTMARSWTVLEPLSAECATNSMAESNEWLSVGKIVEGPGAAGGIAGEARQ